MSFIIGPLSGALVASGVYYGFSTLIQTRTQQHRSDLRELSVRLVDMPTHVAAPPSAAARLSDRGFADEMYMRWNAELHGLFTGFRNASQHTGERVRAYVKATLKKRSESSS
ncbi:hypothetical protein FISHEDRAFT_72461 [Fistulina hepatica ATCC 64428]|uniref:MICOS complex subunit MIC12 n=1 Tax=Fistulina hepatica ATCC 64428 TaxID=1128425 RepID=A0A0D7AEN9_9AGAR|nr:hypothetical protein FISHEDRAFT_72461 [Fistulina hepatica ATCC 64428]